MAPPPAIAAGDRYGRLVVVGEHPWRSDWGERRYICKCDCGGVKVAVSSNLRRGITRSCGCLASEVRRENGRARQTAGGHAGRTHATRTSTYRSWRNAIERCTRTNGAKYEYYGGRGIKVCERWSGVDGFANFLADMGERPDGTSIDRLDPDGDYEPGNCRWATRLEQARENRRSRTGASPGGDQAELAEATSRRSGSA